MHDLIKKAITKHDLTKDDIVFLLNNDEYSEELFKAADEVRQKYVGDEIHLRGLMEFSNYCKNNCYYCGLRRDNKELTRYRIDIPTILGMAEHGRDMGLKTVVLQSGEDVWFTKERMIELVSGIKKLDLALTLSVGEKPTEEYEAYKEAGADRFLLRIETTDKELYAKCHPGQVWEDRARCLRDMKRQGYELGSGCILGLPGQTMESLADDVLFFREIGADMVGVGPFIPHPDTPFKNEKGGTLNTGLKVMALIRLILPDINIPATTAMETLAPNGQVKALQSGANVIMPNITLKQFREHYQLYQGKSSTNVAPDKSLEIVHEKIKSIGRTVGLDYGQSPRWLAERQGL
ncbi:MAG: [FeFe] hydrogenase H-cluster radical SAM maturase HydE [Lactobacillus sp.]|nr:[FeFe] hydrogenase H-cluster radical SAM maturase HydE [Lactobacillus sp.]